MAVKVPYSVEVFKDFYSKLPEKQLLFPAGWISGSYKYQGDVATDLLTSTWGGSPDGECVGTEELSTEQSQLI